jgi:hypothetical protein
MRTSIETKRCWLSSTPSSGLDPTTRRHLPPDGPGGWSASARAVSRRAGQNWLTRRRRSIRQRTSRLPLTAIAAGHVNERSATRHRRNHRNRRTHRNRRSHRSTHRHRRSHRSTHRHRRSHRSTHRNRPRQSQRNTSHVREWSASRTAHARYRRCTIGLAHRRLGTCVAAGWQRGGRNVRAQCHSDPAQPGPSSNYSDVESIKDRHRRRPLHSHSDIPYLSDAAEPHAVPKSRLDDGVNYQQLTSTTRHAAPHRFQMVTFGMV